MRIILVEDDNSLGAGIVTGLEQQNYNVDWFVQGKPALQSIKHESFDLMVLDLGLPDINGIELLKQLRNKGSLLPVLILTAKDDVEDRIAGLDAGADDYLTKPFDLDEVYARIRALIRRMGGRANPIIEYSDIHLDPAAHTVTQADKIVDLSRREYDVLLELLENKGRVMSRARLEEALYSIDDDMASNAVEVHIHHLRKKLGNQLIRTIRGVGYTIDKIPQEK
ncbi:Two-component system response regulator QseB [hydrothermal vent metagenome]|uniref:Two-component system response regulator QseB n=1 Tax=hydrothermal vent metagenome TaxID=652676 RepID=A0A3B0WY65_9ZZZZ